MLRSFSLRHKLIIVVIPLVVVFMAFNYFVIIHHEERLLTQEATERAAAIVSVLTASSADAIAAMNAHDLQLAVDQIHKLKDVENVLIVDLAGRVQASTDLDRAGHPDTDPLLRRSLVNRQPLSRRDGGRLELVAPVLINGQAVGAVKLVVSLGSLQAAIRASSTYILGLTAILVIGSFLFIYWIAQWFARPILRLAATARAVAQGDLTRRAEARSGDELAVLAQAFNDMSAQLRGMMERERRALEDLQGRVESLMALVERVASGDLEVPPATEGSDDMGRLGAGFNDMVRNLRLNLETQRAALFELEESAQALAAANDQLKELDRLKSEFLNTVSHELRTPLTSIKAFSEILLDNAGEDIETQLEFLNIINQESDRLTRLINNLLDLSRIEAGRMQWDIEPLRLRDVTDSCVNATRSLMEMQHLTLAVDVPDDLDLVADRDKLIQVVTNLLSNAIKFTPCDGTITLSAVRRDRHIEIVVADTGVGIPVEHLERIFEKFQQVDASHTREVKGSGLGLPIVRSIVEAHGGKVWVESEPGQGSRFTVSLPSGAAPPFSW